MNFSLLWVEKKSDKEMANCYSKKLEPIESPRNELKYTNPRKKIAFLLLYLLHAVYLLILNTKKCRAVEAIIVNMFIRFVSVVKWLEKLLYIVTLPMNWLCPPAIWKDFMSARTACYCCRGKPRVYRCLDGLTFMGWARQLFLQLDYSKI